MNNTPFGHKFFVEIVNTLPVPPILGANTTPLGNDLSFPTCSASGRRLVFSRLQPPAGMQILGDPTAPSRKIALGIGPRHPSVNAALHGVISELIPNDQ